jgi:hypothetical protein
MYSSEHRRKRRAAPTGLDKPDPVLESPTSLNRTISVSSDVVSPPPNKQVKLEQKSETPDELAPVSPSGKKRATNTEWAMHKAKVIKESTELNAVEQIILAKKTYSPSTGKKTSALVVHRQAWVLRHPDHGLSDSDLKAAIDADLMAKI